MEKIVKVGERVRVEAISACLLINGAPLHRSSSRRALEPEAQPTNRRSLAPHTSSLSTRGRPHAHYRCLLLQPFAAHAYFVATQSQSLIPTPSMHLPPSLSFLALPGRKPQ